MTSTHECMEIKYNWMVPDGGWGYLVVFSSTLFVIMSLGPAVSIALIFGPFLSNKHDELSATTTLTATYGAVFHLTGLITNILLPKTSFRTVALIGALLNCSGNLASIFVSDMQFLIISYGVFQAIGTGMLIPSAFTALNEYFDSRKTFVISICHTIVGATLIIYPAIAQLLMENYGFRGAQAIVAAFSFNSLFGAIVLHPVKWHMKKIPISDETSKYTVSELSSNNDEHNQNNKEFSEVPSDDIESRELLNENISETLSVERKTFSKSLTSVASFGDAATYVGHRKMKQKSSIWNSVDFSLLKDLNYWVIIFALSVSLTSEINVMSLLPVFLLNKGFNDNDVTLMMTTFFATDLIVKIAISLIAAFCKIKSTKIYLANAVLTVIFRIVFAEINSFWFSIILSGLLGGSRCCIHVLNLLILTEMYTDKFASAYSLNMVFSGISAMLLGAIVGFVKNTTGSDSLVLYSLTAAQLICILPWSIKLFYNFVKEKNVKQ